MPEHMSPHAKPSDSGISVTDAKDHSAYLTASNVTTVIDSVTVTTHICPGCGLPHLLRIASTTPIPDMVVSILAMAITDILETYDDDVSSTENTTLFGGNT